MKPQILGARPRAAQGSRHFFSKQMEVVENIIKLEISVYFRTENMKKKTVKHRQCVDIFNTLTFECSWEVFLELNRNSNNSCPCVSVQRIEHRLHTHGHCYAVPLRFTSPAYFCSFIFLSVSYVYGHCGWRGPIQIWKWTVFYKLHSLVIS